MKEMGIGLAAAVLIDATIVRALLLPATMKLLGDWRAAGASAPKPLPLARSGDRPPPRALRAASRGPQRLPG
jgi:hypothetical protein